MIACLDAAYGVNASAAACVCAPDWDAPAPSLETTVAAGAPAAYQPGAFYKRELPLLLAVLQQLPTLPKAIVVDGYVWLDAAASAGLGAHLHAALGGRAHVVGVAKTTFKDAALWSASVRRGRSRAPLYVTSIGIDRADAALAVQRMHGPYRVPTLIKRADALARAAL